MEETKKRINWREDVLKELATKGVSDQCPTCAGVTPNKFNCTTCVKEFGRGITFKTKKKVEEIRRTEKIEKLKENGRVIDLRPAEIKKQEIKEPDLDFKTYRRVVFPDSQVAFIDLRVIKAWAYDEDSEVEDSSRCQCAVIWLDGKDISGRRKHPDAWVCEQTYKSVRNNGASSALVWAIKKAFYEVVSTKRFWEAVQVAVGIIAEIPKISDGDLIQNLKEAYDDLSDKDHLKWENVVTQARKKVQEKENLGKKNEDWEDAQEAVATWYEENPGDKRKPPIVATFIIESLDLPKDMHPKVTKAVALFQEKHEEDIYRAFRDERFRICRALVVKWLSNSRYTLMAPFDLAETMANSPQCKITVFGHTHSPFLKVWEAAIHTERNEQRKRQAMEKRQRLTKSGNAYLKSDIATEAEAKRIRT